MYFPHFAGKTYDFIIFQGGRQQTVYQGTIPLDGKFTLSIPEEYRPYKGMSRWLITGTKEGGGLDMFIPGRDFSVSCKEAMPNNSNIVYTNNDYNKELSDLYKKQESILSCYEVMNQAVRVFSAEDRNYSIFKKELQKQKNAYSDFQQHLNRRSDYISHLLQIVNITRGLGIHLEENQEAKAESINSYIINKLNWEYLYTSGHWNTIIDSWISIHTRVIKDTKRFAKDSKVIESKLKSEKLHYDFSERVKQNLTTDNKQDYLKELKIN
ncbi:MULTISPECIES: alkyl hydroperoxide reductase [Elizabethkingia]|uniref:Alkyl hydroperoxide reductase n=1 Tax=Elizabethkingia meningoseptica TaxID=238 RepID=A0A1T3F7U2_ELIME|nr:MULTISPECIES: alkyl hydroperoxide reductase [Elizabethkingia]AQX14036.1 alkyl hydroperoxide reductase [Elizabethkingia meningoseptica]MBG0515855.1 alkyl hydroperoxide reductase [Elizabethkingia meningoseptica]MDE5436316.1 alkyl hydroperoxide reductase [Elizabethkingia meningoseptica]MDE5538850.1 alkyl hydroperoxide reductase [Elizabethkingia meningoseptica]MDX8575796.1 alkyl hydroperoxide reductase [Elizabethkingia sp. HX WYD]